MNDVLSKVEFDGSPEVSLFFSQSGTNLHSAGKSDLLKKNYGWHHGNTSER